MTSPRQPMSYDVLSDDEKDEIVVTFLKAQERDHYCHSINLERYEGMLDALPEGEFKERIRGLKDETASRIAEVETVIAKTRPQLPAAARMLAAKQRIQAREDAAKV